MLVRHTPPHLHFVGCTWRLATAKLRKNVQLALSHAAK